MNNFYDRTTSFYDITATDNTDLTEDKLLILNGEERMEYFDGTPDFQPKKSRVESVIQYLGKLVNS